jgi:probable HAF family extracellular repeat protein
MKSWTLRCISAITVFAILPISSRLVAQVEQQATGDQIHYVVVNLGTLGGSASNGYGGPNDRGWVTGDANLAGDQNEHGFLWRDGVMTDLGTLGGPNSSVAFPVKNNRGLIVGNAQLNKIDPLGEFWGSAYICTSVQCEGWQNLERGFLWQNGVMRALPTLGGNNDFATGVNNWGQVVGVAETASEDSRCAPPQVLDFEAVIWGPKSGQIQELPVFPGDSVAAALAINDEGQVVGISGICVVPTSYAGGVHAVLWQHGSVTDLGGLGGMMNNAATAINKAGQVVGISDLPGDTATHAFFWENGVMTDIGTLPGDVFSMANDINSKGQVVGVSCDVNFNCRAFLWEHGVMTDLNTTVVPGSSLYLTFGGGINDFGEIAGTALDLNTGGAPAFLAVPVTVPHTTQTPESSVRRINLPDSVRSMLQHRVRTGTTGTH